MYVDLPYMMQMLKVTIDEANLRILIKAEVNLYLPQTT